MAAKAGVTNDRWGIGVAVGDYDNDGWPDLYVTNYGRNRLYHNNRDGTFTDVAEKAGVDLGGWSTGPTFGDYDGDGRLDLFVPGYVHYDVNHPPLPGSAAAGFSAYKFRGVSARERRHHGLPRLRCKERQAFPPDFFHRLVRRLAAHRITGRGSREALEI